jgi:hypothetical protein
MRRAHPPEAVSDTEAAPQPACPVTGRGTQEWRETEYTERLAAFYDPCGFSECFPRGVDGAGPDRIVLSCSHGGSFHRLARASPADTASAVAADGGSAPDPFADGEQVPVGTITDLNCGDRVVWDDVPQPLTVHVPSPAPVGTVQLKGPNGGDYFLEVRPNEMGTVVYPGYGHVSDIRRVVPSETTVASVSK